MYVCMYVNSCAYIRIHIQTLKREKNALSVKVKAAEKDSTVTKMELNKLKAEMKKHNKEFERITSQNYQVNTYIHAHIHMN